MCGMGKSEDVQVIICLSYMRTGCAYNMQPRAKYTFRTHARILASPAIKARNTRNWEDEGYIFHDQNREPRM